MIVLDKIQRRINTNLKHRRSIKTNENGTYDICNDAIFDDYLVSSYEAFTPETAFNPDHYTNGKPINKMCFLKLIGELPKNFDEFAPGADEIIEQKFQNIFDKSNPQEYEKNHHLRSRYREILNVAQTYSDVINAKINNRIINDLAEAQLSLIIDEDAIENISKKNKYSINNEEQIKFISGEYLSSLKTQNQTFNPETPLGKICILKLLKQLPRDFPQKNRDLKKEDIETAQQIYTEIFNDPKNPNHHLLSRILKLATKQKNDVQDMLNHKMEDKVTKLIIEANKNGNNKTLPPALIAMHQCQRRS
jgi:hypothetical protein